MNIQEKIKNEIKKSLEKLGLESEIHLEHPEDLSHGDYSTNVAMTMAKSLGKNPKELAEEIVAGIKGDLFSKVEVAGPGFINFYFSDSFFIEEIKNIDKDFGRNNLGQGKKSIIEYTDPNPFKLFHIGHLMSNTVGESISRLMEFSGYEVKRANYQGDVGAHVAKAVWGVIKNGGIKEDRDIKGLVAYLGQAYADGSNAYDENKDEINEINKKIYSKEDPEINKIYEWGRQISLDYFETQYKLLGTKFDFYFFESEAGPYGKEIVEKFLDKGVFEKSDGAIIFDGEKHGLHKRVFINGEGLPTYEAKELGLAKIKFDKYKYDTSVVVTANEIDAYFKVLLKAMGFTFPELAEKTKHISHGVMKLSTGKMSSRTGDVVEASDFIDDVKNTIKRALKDDDDNLLNMIAIGAIKFYILKQNTKKDIVYDVDKSVSFEGDSGPYLQYTYARCKSLIKSLEMRGIRIISEKSISSDGYNKEIKYSYGNISFNLPAGFVGGYEDLSNTTDFEDPEFERLLRRFPEVVEEAVSDWAPHHIAIYLLDLSRRFNSIYSSKHKFIEEDDSQLLISGNISIVKDFSFVLKNGLYLLGIESPDRM